MTKRDILKYKVFNHYNGIFLGILIAYFFLEIRRIGLEHSDLLSYKSRWVPLRSHFFYVLRHLSNYQIARYFGFTFWNWPLPSIINTGCLILKWAKVNSSEVVTNRTSTVRFGPNDRNFFCRTQNFFFFTIHCMYLSKWLP